jgi:hypothetical protein
MLLNSTFVEFLERLNRFLSVDAEDAVLELLESFKLLLQHLGVDVLIFSNYHFSFFFVQALTDT